MRHFVRLASGVLASLAILGPAWAGAPTEQVRRYTDQVVRILENPELKSADKRAAVRKVANQVFDVNETARRALGRHWQGRSPAEREEFVQLFADLLERTYISKIDLYRGERLRYVSETVEGDYAVVRAKVLTQKGLEVPVEARLLKRSDHWLIYDIVIENVSLIGNYRMQFDRIIRTTSFQELVRRLRENRDQFIDQKATTGPRAS
jgi:phospholipid transport system substrate-binding protein